MGKGERGGGGGDEGWGWGGGVKVQNYTNSEWRDFFQSQDDDDSRLSAIGSVR